MTLMPEGGKTKNSRTILKEILRGQNEWFESDAGRRRRKEGRMKKIVLIAFLLLCLSLAPGLTRADCLDLSGFTSWALQDESTVIFYRGNQVLAMVTFSNCTVQPSSRIRLLKNYVCEADEIQVDDDACSIISVKVGY